MVSNKAPILALKWKFQLSFIATRGATLTACQQRERIIISAPLKYVLQTLASCVEKTSEGCVTSPAEVVSCWHCSTGPFYDGKTFLKRSSAIAKSAIFGKTKPLS